MDLSQSHILAFDYIIVIESLPLGEDRTGKILFDTVIDRRAEQKDIGAIYRYVSNKEELKKSILRY